MAEFSRPATNVDKLLFAQRCMKAATFRTDQKQAIRELCECVTELINALLEREKGCEVKSEEKKPAE